MLHKLFQALRNFPRAFSRTPHPKVVMTLLVKNEAELLETNLRFHHAMGVDAFVVTDNGSTDATPEIIQYYVEKGWIVEHISEPDTGYHQKKWVDRMVLAAQKHGADWVINADADEFWFAPIGNFKTLLATTSANVLRCRVANMLPREDRPFTEWDEVVQPIDFPDRYGLSPFSIYGRTTFKVLHRTAGYLQISMGNHKVLMLPRKQEDSDIVIYHFNVRSRKQFVEKMINGGRELENNPSKHGGRHWRYFYDLHKAGKLEEEYDRVVGTSVADTLRTAHFIVSDSRLKHFFAQMR